MHCSKRFLIVIFLTVFLVIPLFVSTTFIYLVMTPSGGKILVHYFLQEASHFALMHVGHYEGTLHEGFILKDVQVRGLPYLPDALVSIQQVRVRFPLWDWRHSDADILNARIFLPDCDTVVFTGQVYAGQIKGNLYAKSLDLHTATRFWANEDIQKNLQGFISNIDITFQGPVSAPVVSGHFLADGIRYKSVFLTDGFSRLHLTLIPANGGLQMKGKVVMDSGTLVVRRVNLELTKSRVYFQGDVFNPRLDIHAGAKVEETDIHLAFRGTLAKPVLIVTSNPPLPPQDALNMLFTGNAWSVTSGSPMNGAANGGALAQDFLNYSLGENNSGQSFGFKRKLTDKLKLGMERDETTSLPGGDAAVYYSNKVVGEMDLSNHMSLNVSQAVLPQDSNTYPTSQETQGNTETQIYLQYKKRF